MNTEPICLPCKSKGVEPVVTSALHQTCGNPLRAVLFFCCKCCSVHDRVDLGEMPPCLVPWKAWQSMRKIPPTLLRFYAVRFTLKLGKWSPTSSRRARFAAQTVSHENIVEDGAAFLREQYRAAFNAFIRCQQPTTHIHESQMDGSNRNLCSENLRCS